MKLLKNNETLEFDTAGYATEFICRCDLVRGEPHVHVSTDERDGRRETGDGLQSAVSGRFNRRAA